MPDAEEIRKRIVRLKSELLLAEHQEKEAAAQVFEEEIRTKYAGKCFLLKYMVNGNGQSFAAIKLGSKIEWRSRKDDSELSVRLDAKHVHVYCIPEGGKGTEWWGPKVERCDRKEDFKQHDTHRFDSGIVKEIDPKEFKRIWNMVHYVTTTFLDRMLNPPAPPVPLNPEHAPAAEPDPEFLALPS